jgi:RNA polymerase sigma-B factor
MMTKQFDALPAKEPWPEYIAFQSTCRRDQLIERYRPLVLAVLRRMGCLGDEDLEQAALIGLVGALNRFDPANGCPFEAFALPTIAGEVKRYLRDHSRLLRPPRSLVELGHAVRQEEARLIAMTGQSPTVAAIANALGVDLDRVVEAMTLEDTCHPQSLNSLMDSPHYDYAVTREEFLGEEDPALTSADTRLVVEQALAALEPRLREVIMLCFYEELSQKEAASRLGVSQMQVSRLQRRALDQLRGQAAHLDGLISAGA